MLQNVYCFLRNSLYDITYPKYVQFRVGLYNRIWRYLMNFKTMLLATAAVTMIAGTASAKDFTGSLFLPSKGQVLSETNIDYSREKYKWGYVDKALVASEELTYGVTDNFSVYGGIANAFNFDKITSREYNNEHNFAYELGVKYNYNFDRILTQIGFGYQTYQLASWYGHRFWDDNEWTKIITFEGQIGYDLGNGWLPYASFSGDSLVDTKDRAMDYAAFAGVHKTCDKVAFDTGLRYEFNTDRGPNTNELYWQAEVNYFVNEKVAVGVHGDYYIGGTDDGDIKYDTTVGAQLKVLF